MRSRTAVLILMSLALPAAMALPTASASPPAAVAPDFAPNLVLVGPMPEVMSLRPYEVGVSRVELGTVTRSELPNPAQGDHVENTAIERTAFAPFRGRGRLQRSHSRIARSYADRYTSLVGHTLTKHRPTRQFD